MNFLETCKALIGIDSTPTNGNVEMAEYCALLCRGAGLSVHLQEGHFGGKKHFNLLARPSRNEATEEVVFQTHLDTVEPGPHGRWTKTDSNPFRAVVADGNIYGLGTADVKLDFLCKLEAIKKQKKKHFEIPFVLVGTFAEETGMIGAQQLIKTKAFNARKAVIGEPSELQIVYANNGYLVTETLIPFTEEEKIFRKQHSEESFPKSQEKVFHGKAAHSSTPHLGENALIKVADYLAKLPQGVAVLDLGGGVSVNTVPAEAHIEIDGSRSFKNSVGDKFLKMVRAVEKLDREFLGFNDEEFKPSHPTSNIAMARTRDEALVLDISFRITPNITQNQVDSWLGRLTQCATEFGGEFRTVRFSPPALTRLDSDLVQQGIQVCKELGLPDKPITKASGTECSIYANNGIECVVFGPGKSIGNSHTANEYNILEHLDKAILFYDHMIQRMCR